MTAAKQPVNGKAEPAEILDIDINDLSVDEAVELEELSGQAIADLASGKTPTAKLIRSLVFLTRRRTDSGYTLAQAGTEKLSRVIARAAGPN
ncbi:MAG: hypothetical protein GEU73_11150 [Chloroflexi bacterium]|nr:hypothetical protein [Chloroflexota bacterium]